MDLGTVHKQIGIFQNRLQDLIAATAQDEDARKKLLGVVTQAMNVLDTPAEVVLRMMHSVSYFFNDRWSE